MNATPLMLEAQTIAIEHVLWETGRGTTPRQVLESIGIRWPDHRDPDWLDCVRGLTDEYRKLRRAQRIRDEEDEERKSA